MELALYHEEFWLLQRPDENPRRPGRRLCHQYQRRLHLRPPPRHPPLPGLGSDRVSRSVPGLRARPRRWLPRPRYPRRRRDPSPPNFTRPFATTPANITRTSARLSRNDLPPAEKFTCKRWPHPAPGSPTSAWSLPTRCSMPSPSISTASPGKPGTSDSSGWGEGGNSLAWEDHPVQNCPLTAIAPTSLPEGYLTEFWSRLWRFLPGPCQPPRPRTLSLHRLRLDRR